MHRLFSLAKRWLEGTHQGRVEVADLESYLDEFMLRLNRHTTRRRGLLFLRLLERAVAADPIRYRDLITSPRPHPAKRPPMGVRQWPGTLAPELLARPGRAVP